MAYDVIVVGGSYAGLSAAMQLARSRRQVVVVDAGEPRNRFADAGHGFFGQDGKAPDEILTEARRQLALYPTVEFIDGVTESATVENGAFVVTLGDGRELTGTRLVLATGLRDDLAPLPGLKERWGRTVLHCPYCHGFEVRDRQLAVLASSPMALHQAILIAELGPTTFFTQEIVELTDEDVAHLTSRGVAIERTPVVELLGEAPELDGVRLSDGRFVPLDAIFTGAPLMMASPLAEQLGCAFDDGPLGKIVRVDEINQTTVPGVFAGGDMAIKMSNATLASASGVMAGVAAHRSLVLDDAYSLAVRRVKAAQNS